MKKILALATALLILSVSYVSSAEPINDNQDCSGAWTLLNEHGWVVKNKNGIIIPLSYSTIIYGCDSKPIKLYSGLNKARVTIKCLPLEGKDQTPTIQKLYIICE